jgi:hypothetical protein
MTYQNIPTADILAYLNVKSADELKTLFQKSFGWDVSAFQINKDCVKMPIIKENSMKPTVVRESLKFERKYTTQR